MTLDVSLLDESRLKKVSGHEAFTGGRWRHVTASEKLPEGSDKVAAVAKCVAGIKAKVLAVLKAFAGGSVDPKDVEVYVLDGEWMNETVMPPDSPCGPAVFVDATFDMRYKDAVLEECHVLQAVQAGQPGPKVVGLGMAA